MAYADIKEKRQQFSDDTAEWQAIRDEGAIDMRHASGDPWDPKDRKAREDAGRVCISLDELGQYTNQVVNEVRANKRAVKFAPVGNGANDDTAEFYADKMREIEYRSRAQIGYTTAFENAVQRSYGFVRVSTRYEHARSVNQDIWIDPVHNPDLITPDPYALMPDLSDMKHCWVREPWTREDFNRRWPKYKIDGKAVSDLSREAPTWVNDKQVWVSEQWEIRTQSRKLLIIQPPAPVQPGGVLQLQQAPPEEPVGIFEDEIPKGQRPPGKVLTTRQVDDPTVYQCLTNGIEVLEETHWPGKFIPIIACLGKVIYLDEGVGSKRKILSMIRLARDPYMLYCYYRTCELELVGMTPKFPYFARRGSLKPDQLVALQKSLHEPVAVIEVETQVEGLSGQPPEFPVRQPYEPPIQALEVGAEAARRAIQAAIGQSPLPTQAQRRNEKSGVALKRIEEAGQRGSFHFTDHYLDMVTQVGVVIEDLIPKIYDTARNVGVRRPNDTAEIIRINDPNQADSVSTKGDHLVTVSTGPSFESEREAASDFADTLAQTSPEVFALLGPLIVKLKNLGPVGDEMIELLESVQPPQVQQARASKDKPGDPQQMAQELQQTKAQMQQLEQVAKQMKEALDTDQVKQQATITKAKMDGDIQIQLQHIRNAAAIEIAEINAKVKGYQVEDARMQEQEALALGHAHDSHEAELQRQHDAAMAAAGHVQGMEAGDQAHQQALEQGDQAHEQALEQGDQGVAGQLAVQAAQPQPENGASA